MIFTPLLFLNLIPILPLKISAVIIGFSIYIFLKQRKVRNLLLLYVVTILIRYALNQT